MHLSNGSNYSASPPPVTRGLGGVMVFCREAVKDGEALGGFSPLRRYQMARDLF